MRVYDFDKTIYAGDSTTHFYLYCLLRHPGILATWPRLLAALVRYARRRITKTQMKQTIYGFLAHVPDVEAAVDAFWAAREARLRAWYLAQSAPEDLVISASPEFLLRPLLRRRGMALLASRVDPRTGQYDGLNCDGEEKVRRYRAQYGSAPIEAFYSDSLHDAPLARLAQRSYLVRGERLRPWPQQDNRKTRAK